MNTFYFIWKYANISIEYNSVVCLGGVLVQSYEDRATMYAERYGIVVYRVKGKYMIYNKSYSEYLCNPRYTVQHKIDLDTGKDETRVLKKFDKKGYLNV